ncbi:MAG: hypothetical protein KAR79_06035 [Simkaniaceae bacterium]|nr:hypothetical protein [Simkaniaceae bacterium]
MVPDYVIVDPNGDVFPLPQQQKSAHSFFVEGKLDTITTLALYALSPYEEEEKNLLYEDLEFHRTEKAIARFGLTIPLKRYLLEYTQSGQKKTYEFEIREIPPNVNEKISIQFFEDAINIQRTFYDWNIVNTETIS